MASGSQWQLAALLAERVEKARRLAAEDEDLRDDSGLKVGWRRTGGGGGRGVRAALDCFLRE